MRCSGGAIVDAANDVHAREGELRRHILNPAAQSAGVQSFVVERGRADLYFFNYFCFWASVLRFCSLGVYFFYFFLERVVAFLVVFSFFFDG